MVKFGEAGGVVFIKVSGHNQPIAMMVGLLVHLFWIVVTSVS